MVKRDKDMKYRKAMEMKKTMPVKQRKAKKMTIKNKK